MSEDVPRKLHYETCLLHSSEASFCGYCEENWPCAGSIAERQNAAPIGSPEAD